MHVLHVVSPGFHMCCLVSKKTGWMLCPQNTIDINQKTAHQEVRDSLQDRRDLCVVVRGCSDIFLKNKYEK